MFPFFEITKSGVAVEEHCQSLSGGRDHPRPFRHGQDLCVVDPVGQRVVEWSEYTVQGLYRFSFLLVTQNDTDLAVRVPHNIGVVVQRVNFLVETLYIFTRLLIYPEAFLVSQVGRAFAPSRLFPASYAEFDFTHD